MNKDKVREAMELMVYFKRFEPLTDKGREGIQILIALAQKYLNDELVERPENI